MQDKNYLSKDKTQALIDGLGIKQSEGKAFLEGLAARGYTIQGFNDQPKPEEPTVMESIKTKLAGIGEKQTDTIQNAARLYKEGKQGLLPTIGETIGASIGAAGESFALPVNEAVNKAISFVGEYAPENIKQAATELAKKGIELSKPSIEAYNALPEEKKAQVKGLTDLISGITNLAIGSQAVKPIGGAVSATVETVPKVAGKAVEKTAGVVKKGVETGQTLITPVKTVEQAVGQIAQGGTGALKPVEVALSSIDTSKVKTFKDLLNKIDESIPTIAKQVDEELLKDKGVYPLSELATQRLTKAGNTVTTNFVDRGLKQLSELYSTIGDDVAKADIDDLITKAETVGLTRKEVNDISRVYGQEFGAKAFSKLGEPLTSVNAQNFQNVREGLKEVARQGIGGEEAKVLDSKLSALYDTQKLIEKNVEAVNKIKQRISERGLLEKAGNIAAKTIDILSGGTIRGLVGGLLPRGAGYKVMNALDIETALRGNLDIIEKALKQESDDAFLKILKDSQSYLLGNKKDLITSSGKTTNQTIAPKIPKNNNISNISPSIPQTTKKASSKVSKK